MSVKIGICQFHIEWEDKKTNYERANEFIKEAAEEEADIILFPEMSFTGFSMNVKFTAENNQETWNRMQALAIEYSIAIGFGWVKKNREKAENHYSIISKKGIVLTDYIKIHSFNFGGEGKEFISGNEIKIFEFKDFKIAPFICYDLRFPEIFQCASKSAEILIVPANWPSARSLHWNCLLQARAIENQAYVLGINCVGKIGDLYYSGESCIINPNGEVEQKIKDKEMIIYSTIEKSKFEIREAFPVKKDRKEDLYRRITY